MLALCFLNQQLMVTVYRNATKTLLKCGIFFRHSVDAHYHIHKNKLSFKGLTRVWNKF